MPKAVIASIGGTPEPVAKALAEYAPAFTVFFASQDSLEKISIIKQHLRDKGIAMRSEVTLVDDVNDLLHCHARAQEAIGRALAKGYARDGIVVDYTGGTKNMSVALALAAITHGVSFSYVGGAERTKDGLGVVMDGHERVYHNVNPWDVLAVEEKRKLEILCGQYQYRAARDLISFMLEKNISNKPAFKKLWFVMDGYHKWDAFRHKDALDCFTRAKIDELAECADAGTCRFAAATEKLMPFLKQLISGGKNPSRAYMLDIFANAERRMHEGKTDDAIVRLYRIVEMIAQERLQTGYGIDASNVKEEQLPDVLRSEYLTRYQGDGKIKIPQVAAFRLLDALDDPVGHLFEERRESMQKIGNSRNDSWLAHGLGSAKEETYVKLREFVEKLEVINPEDAPRFPPLAV
ncbi:MAG TPA: TIGR02710 family CRISPR-associated CARF protein [Dissulfurispiraceae bacterium]|nr:TIGR02710 family CRISPR-associated CARF protein [Dissulfurispiraceae bacterium]